MTPAAVSNAVERAGRGSHGAAGAPAADVDGVVADGVVADGAMVFSMPGIIGVKTGHLLSGLFVMISRCVLIGWLPFC